MKDVRTTAKEMQERYGTKQRDELRANHPELADGVEKVQEVFGPVTSVKVSTKEEEQRTILQNKALHKYFELLAEALNNAGWDMKKTLKEEVEIPWTKDMVKNHLWRPIQEIMFSKHSTTEMNTKDPSEIYVVLDRHLSSKTGVHVEFPKDDEKRCNYRG